MHTNKDWLIQKYHVEELSVSQIAQMASRDVATVFYWMKKLNIKRRGRVDAINLFFKNHPEKIRRKEKTGNWNGGIVKDYYGYIRILMPEHPNANCYGYVKRCVVIAVKVLGRSLKINEMTHHINGIKDDDRHENLLICTTSYHAFLNSRMKRRDSSGRFVKILEREE